MALALTRKPNESILIGDAIRVTIISVKGEKVRISVEAPREVQVSRPDAKRQTKRAEVPDMSHLTEM